MPKEFEVAGYWPCYSDINKKFIAEGINSIVFKVDDYALKVYRKQRSGGGIDLNQLRLYGEITKEASDLLESEGWTINLPFPLGQRKLEVNRFINIAECDKCGRLEAWTPFVSGVKLRSSIYSFLDFDGEINIRLFDLSSELRRRLGFDGISIDTVNVKSRAPSALVITDLCYDISILRQGRLF